MSSDTNTIFELSDPVRTAIPARSRLYHLEPIGMGTPYVESLTSYTMRLAEAHCVFTRTLVNREVAPLFDNPVMWTMSRGIWTTESYLLNGHGKTAREWLSVLERLTLRRDLRFLTMLTWADVLPARRLLRHTRAWCPACYEDWRRAGQVIYDPLLWSLEAITVCPQHRRRLRLQCHYEDCHKSVPVLAARSRPGYCSQCVRWLGTPLDENCTAEAIQEDELKWPIWVVETVGDLIAAAPRLSELPSRAKIAEAINACVKQMAGGNAASFSHELQMWESQTWRLQHGHGPVTIDLLLKICHHAGVSLVRFLTEGAGAIQSREINPRMFDNVPAQPEKSRRRHDYDSLRSALEGVLASDEDPPLSMLQVCQCLDVDPANIRQRLPGLCQAISARYRNYQKAKRLEEHRQICNEVRQATRSIHLLGMYATSTRVRALLSDPGYLRRRDAMATWRETLLELGWKR